VALVGLGVTMIYSASVGVDERTPGWQFWKDPSLKQLAFVPPALFAMWLASHIPHTFWRLRRVWILSPSIWLLVLALALLVAVLVAPARIAPKINGAKRWFVLGAGFSFQPSELAKLAMVVALAALLSDVRFPSRRFFAGMLPLIALIGIVVVPIIKEDFGTAFLVFLVAGCLLIAGGTKFWQLLLFIPPAAMAAAFVVMTSPFRRARVENWWKGADPQGAGYHINQSLMAIASGSWTGRGLGDGIQKFYYLPEGTTDFIFSNICEELGLVGAFIIIGLFIMLIWQLRRTMLAARDTLGQLIALGVLLTIGFQAAMNLAVVTDTVPPKGIALPFVSAGGSGLILMSIALGVAASVARTTRKQIQ
ncbi:MAG: FtsW/RodA/SpoVE family cell cycle protein, partial [Phycisphaerae bacterium]|nr:FtsW/RodA/SpoVE family cell cycle protein [Phycisphaerae bacterium]